MKIQTSGRLILLLTAACLFTPLAAQASGGLPGSPAFGFGAWLDTSGQQVELSVQRAGEMGIEWLGVELDWAALQPEKGVPLDSASLDYALSLASTNNLSVMVSIRNAPDWAMTAAGPKPNLTAKLVLYLSGLHPNLMAVEVFPEANTIQGWGAAPNAEAYLKVIQKIGRTLQEGESVITLVAGGLAALPPNHAPEDIDDLLFLEELYRLGGGGLLPILSIRYNLAGREPMKTPSDDPYTLRRYELVRNVMLRYGQETGTVWITKFSWPLDQPAAEQTAWMQQAYSLMNSQLYIGAAFFDQLNPGAEENSNSSLALPDGSLHPASETLADFNLSGSATPTASSPVQLGKTIRYRERNFEPKR